MDRLLGKMLPNSAARSNSSSGQLTQSICLSHALLASWHVLHLGACGAQCAQLAEEGLHPAPSTQHAVAAALAAVLVQGSTMPSTGCAGGLPDPQDRESPAVSLWVSLQLNSDTAELCFAPRLNLSCDPRESEQINALLRNTLFV